MLVLQARGVGKSVGRGAGARRLLEGLDLDVRAGEMVAIVGRSGEGKSTLLNLLGALDRPDTGTIELLGEPLATASERERTRIRLRRVGFVFQSFQLIEELTGGENVLLPARLPGAPPGGDARGRRLLRELGLEQVADRTPSFLSGGEQQRLAIARALVNDPALVLADEPTGNLDAASAATVLALLRELAHGERSVVLVTHEERAVAEADRVLRLSAGRLHADATGSHSP